jgi:hypothetical protein
MCKSLNEKFSTWMAWIWYFMCLTLLWSSSNSSNLKWASGRGINSQGFTLVVSWKLKAIPSDDLMLCFSRASVHPVLLVVSFHRTWLLTQSIRCFNWCTIGSSGAEDSTDKILLLLGIQESDETPEHVQERIHEQGDKESSKACISPQNMWTPLHVPLSPLYRKMKALLHSIVPSNLKNIPNVNTYRYVISYPVICGANIRYLQAYHSFTHQT